MAGKAFSGSFDSSGRQGLGGMAMARVNSCRHLSRRGKEKHYLLLPLSFCTTRALTIFLINSTGMGLSVGKCTVPLDVEKPFSSSLNCSITAAVGNRLQWLENAAYQTSTFLCLNAGITFTDSAGARSASYQGPGFSRAGRVP